MDLFTVIAGALIANLITFGLLLGMWRLNRTGYTLGTTVILLLAFGAITAVGLLADQPSAEPAQEPTTQAAP